MTDVNQEIHRYLLQNEIPLPTITLHICDRSPESFDTVRKFMAECGTKLEVRLTRHGKIRSIRPVDPCRNGAKCSQCADRRNKIEELIEAGK